MKNYEISQVCQWQQQQVPRVVFSVCTCTHTRHTRQLFDVGISASSSAEVLGHTYIHWI